MEFAGPEIAIKYCTSFLPSKATTTIPHHLSSPTIYHSAMLLLNTIRRPLGATLLVAKPLARSLSTSPVIRPPILRQAFARHPVLKPFQSGRFFTTEPAIVARPPRQEAIQKLIYSGALFGGTLLAANLLFNRETRETAIPLYERAYLQETFTYTGVGLGMIGRVIPHTSFKDLTLIPV